MALAQPVPMARAGVFCASPHPDSYAWWYADGLSHDRNYAFTLIAFIGSVFSPYYAWSGRTDPHNHCAINLALYGRRHARWAMTERGRADLSVSPEQLIIGTSSLTWDDGSLTADIREYGAPIPQHVCGRIVLRPKYLNAESFGIDAAGDHEWRPIAPAAEVSVDFRQPDLNWAGTGYFDTNYGRAPLEEAFRFWDWSRVQHEDGRSALLYNLAERTGNERSLALRFSVDGRCETFAPPPKFALPPTPVFRIQRTTRAISRKSVHLGRTLEDAPFYSRSIIESDILGARAAGIHESFDGDRFRSPLVKLMLPFRMPRRPIMS